MNIINMKKPHLVIFIFLLTLNRPYAQNSSLKNIALKEDQLFKNKSNIEIFESKQQQVQFKVELFGMSVEEIFLNHQKYHRIFLNGFTENDETGNPAVPLIGKFIAVPRGANVEVIITDAKYKQFEQINVLPSPLPQQENEESLNTPFIINDKIYNSDQFYPTKNAWTENVKFIRNRPVTILRFAPIQFNPMQKKIKVLTECTIVVEFHGGTGFGIDKRYYSPVYEKMFKRIVVNSDILQTDNINLGTTSENNYPGCDYLIITNNKFSEAADSLALWRKYCGLRTKIEFIENIGNTAVQVKNYIQSAYDTWDPAPTYILLLGDAEYIPTNYETDHPSSDNGRIGTDLYYATVDGSDFLPDLFISRIPVDFEIEALTFANKIINFEKNPPTDPSFYNNVEVAAYFQDDDSDGYEDSRFILTSEEIRNFLLSEGYSTNRIYYANPSVTPTNYNNGSYANGEPLPPEILRSNGFLWNGDAADISSAIESGSFLVNHRDHGSRSGWGDPYYRSGHVRDLTNRGKLPIVFSTNCATGWFDNETDDPITGTSANSECFVEYWIRNILGGALGVFGSTRVSYSGYNDALAKGYFDAIWPQFLTYQPSGLNTPIFYTSAILNYAKLYMYSQYASGSRIRIEFEEFHYYGDPATTIFTEDPLNFVVQPVDSCFFNQTDLAVYLNQQNAIVTLLQNNDIITSELSDANGTATLTFSPINSNATLVLSVTKPDFKPYLANINVYSGTGVSIVCESPQFWDEDYNEEINIGENITWKLNLKNVGGLTAKQIQLKITSSDSFITLLDSIAAIDSLQRNETISVSALSFFVHNECPQDHEVSMQLTIEALSGFQLSVPLDFTVRQGVPTLSYNPSMVATSVSAQYDSTSAILYLSNNGFGKLQLQVQDESKGLITIGDTINNNWYNVPAGAGNIYQANQSANLMKFSTFLDISSPIDIYFFMYEGNQHQGIYYKIGESSAHISQLGKSIIWSDDLDIPLQNNKYYYLGVSWQNGNAQIARSNDLPPVNISFGSAMTGAVNLGGFPPADSIDQTINQIFLFVQSLEIGKGNWFKCPLLSTELIPTENLDIPMNFYAASSDTIFNTNVLITSNDVFRDSVLIPVTFFVGSDSVNLVFNASHINDSNGNNNNEINIGETISFPLSIKNLGISSASNIIAKFILQDNNISVVDSIEVLGTLNPGQEINVSAFEIDVSPHCTPLHQFQYKVQILADNNYQVNTTYQQIVLEGDPSIAVQPDSLIGTIAILNDSLIHYLEITNEGYGPLIFQIDNPLKNKFSIGSVKPNSWLPISDGVGNVYLQVLTTNLLEFESYFEAEAEAQIYFFIYEGDSILGEYNLKAYNKVTIQETDTCWISSGILNCQLTPFKYYYFGTSWIGNVKISRMNEIIPLTMDTGLLLSSSFELGGIPPENTIYRTTSSSAPVAQKFTSGDGLWLKCSEEADTLFPRENITIPIKLYATAPDTILFCNLNVIVDDPQNQIQQVPVSLKVTALPNNISKPVAQLPHSLEVRQNYPNPFNNSTTIQYEIPQKVNAEIIIFNVLGQKVKSLINKVHDPGYYKIEWDGKNNLGRIVSSGVYFIVLKTQRKAQIRKMLLLK